MDLTLFQNDFDVEGLMKNSKDFDAIIHLEDI